jgi:hypothetical protein
MGQHAEEHCLIEKFPASTVLAPSACARLLLPASMSSIIRF